MKITTSIIALFVTFGQLSLAQVTLPATTKSYISTHFPKEKISHTKMDDGKYEVHLSSGYELEFNRDGKIRKIEGNGYKLPGSVSQAISCPI